MVFFLEKRDFDRRKCEGSFVEEGGGGYWFDILRIWLIIKAQQSLSIQLLSSLRDWCDAFRSRCYAVDV